MPTLIEIETALDQGRLEVYVIGRGKWYAARRNGQTKLWKTRPNEFRIPIKYMFNMCSAITHIDAEHEYPYGFRFMPERSHAP